MATTTNGTTIRINREFVRKVDDQLVLIQEYGKSRYMAPIKTTVTRTERGLIIGHELTGPFRKVS